MSIEKENNCQVSLAIDALTGCVEFVGHGILMELYGLLGLECSCEHLVIFDVLVEDLVPLGVSDPGTIECVSCLDTDQMRWNVDFIARSHKALDFSGISAGVLELLDQVIRAGILR